MHDDRLSKVGRLSGWVKVWVMGWVIGLALWGFATGAKAQSAPNAPTDAVITDCTNDAQLRAALLAAGPSTVTFDCGPTPHTIPISFYMEIAGNITIDGAEQITLDGNDTAALIQVFATGDVTLRNITLTRGISNGAHPIENLGKLALINVTVQNNVSGLNGGAVFNNINGTLVVRDSQFLSNTSVLTSTTTNGAAIHSEGVATVEDSFFQGNELLGPIGLGGGIAVMGGRFTIERSHFNDNSALDGGALYVAPSTVVTVTHSLFDFNHAGYGGAIETQGELQLDYSTFFRNYTLSPVAAGDGGAVWVVGSDLDVTYSNFVDNSAGTTGGAISCYDSNISIINSTLSGNSSLTTGGGLYSTCDVNMSNTTLHDNSAATAGGGVYIGGDAFASMTYITLSQNESPVGAGVYNDSTGSSSITLQASLLANNSPANCSGVLVSNGYNFSSDATCADFVQTGDRLSVALPLGPLQANGGPTQTRIPLSPNPVINAIPAAACGFSVDQRDTARPQKLLCDAGAVEVLYSGYLPSVLNP